MKKVVVGNPNPFWIGSKVEVLKTEKVTLPTDEEYDLDASETDENAIVGQVTVGGYCGEIDGYELDNATIRFDGAVALAPAAVERDVQSQSPTPEPGD